MATRDPREIYLMMNQTVYPILNPNIYLNYLTPKVAGQFELARNIRLGTIGAIIWDILLYLPDDVRIIARMGLRPTVLCFILTRLSSLTFITISVIKKTGPLAHCDAVEIGETFAAMLTIMTYSFLFLRRVQAFWTDNKIVKHLFSLLWLANAGVSIVLPLGSHAAPMANTGYCSTSGMESWVSSNAFVHLAFDSLVFLGVSYKLAKEHSNTGGRITWSTVVSGKALPSLGRAVLQGGQQYYLFAVVANILVTIMLIEPVLIPVYHAALMTPIICLVSSMACRVFRNLNLAAHRDPPPLLPTTTHSIRFNHTAQGTTNNVVGGLHGTLDSSVLMMEENEKTVLESPVSVVK